jgi:UPF0755 protein
MKKQNLFVLFFIIFLFVLQGIYLAPVSNSGEKIFSVKRGEGVFEIAQNLKKEELIKSPFFFNFYILLTGKTRNLQAGDYLLSSSLSVKEIAQNMIEGNSFKEREITIIEGWGIKEIGNYFADRGIFSYEEVIEKSKSSSFDFDFLEDNIEGYLFPDTYRIYRDDEVEDVFEKMILNFEEKVVKGLKEKIERQERSLSDIIIMASMIEREVINIDEKKVVSGLLWKRKENGIPLQVDATINYITGRREITKEDKKIDSPYNTYQYKGLPLGAICNPGIESIVAALEPKETNFWYYLSRPDGVTMFSKTLEEHNVKKSKYLNQD